MVSLRSPPAVNKENQHCSSAIVPVSPLYFLLIYYIIANQRHGNISLQVRCAIVTCRLLFQYTFEEIEQKTGVQIDTAAKIMRRAIFQAGNKDFNDVLAYVGDIKRYRRPQRVEEGSQISADIRNAMLKHYTLKPVEAVKKENLFQKVGQKRPARSTLERVQHDHIHKDPNSSFIDEIVRVTVPEKPHLATGDKPKRKEWYNWAVKEIENGAIFICTRAAEKSIFLAVRYGNTHQSNSLLCLYTKPLLVMLASYG